MHVLVAEDDAKLRDVLDRGLRSAGYAVDVAARGDEALELLLRNSYAAAIIDWRMPVKDGIDVVTAIRAGGLATPVLMLTARDTPSDRIQGLDAGCDDYLVKPFDFEELLARLRALMRRPPATLGVSLRAGALTIDPAARLASVKRYDDRADANGVCDCRIARAEEPGRGEPRNHREPRVDGCPRPDCVQQHRRPCHPSARQARRSGAQAGGRSEGRIPAPGAGSVSTPVGKRALRLALITTAVVAALILALCVAIDVIVAQTLRSSATSRLTGELAHLAHEQGGPNLTEPDVDDPVLVWRVNSAGGSWPRQRVHRRFLPARSPQPRRPRRRLRALTCWWPVSGFQTAGSSEQSASATSSKTLTALAITEAIVGPVLLVLVFAGAFVVGTREPPDR